MWELTVFYLSLWYDAFLGRDDQMVPTRAAQLRNLLCRLGPSFIKAGQVCATEGSKLYGMCFGLLHQPVPGAMRQLRCSPGSFVLK